MGDKIVKSENLCCQPVVFPGLSLLSKTTLKVIWNIPCIFLQTCNWSMVIQKVAWQDQRLTQLQGTGLLSVGWFFFQSCSIFIGFFHSEPIGMANYLKTQLTWYSHLYVWFLQYWVSHSKPSKVILLRWRYRLWFLLILWILCVP